MKRRSINDDSDAHSNNSTPGCFSTCQGGVAENAVTDTANFNSAASFTRDTKSVKSAGSFLNQGWERRKSKVLKKPKRKSLVSVGGDTANTNDHPDLSSLIASELTKLSIEDRVKALEEIHGVVEDIEEDPKEIHKLFDQVKEELKRIRYKQAYEKAAFLSSTYVINPDFVLPFLRADSYNPRHAAIRLAEHFKYKLELFGEHTLVRDIFYDDLTADEKLILNSGFVETLPTTDRAGRQIILCNMSDFLKVGNLKNVCRAMWYLCLRNAQMTLNNLGIVGVYFTHGMGNIFDTLYRNNQTNFVNGTGFMQNALPYKLGSVHFCFENHNNFGSTIQKFIMMSLGKHARIRLRSHCGSRIECEYALKSFGIDIDTFKKCPSSGLSLSVQQWVESCKALDELHRKELEMRVLVGPNDVLLGRGRPFQLYSGNLILAAIIDENRARYTMAKKMHKKAITIEIVEIIHKSGGRFLKKVSNAKNSSCDWEDVDFETARLKVSHSFRTMSKGQTDNEDACNKGNEEILVESIHPISTEDANSLGLMPASVPSDVDPLMTQIPFSSANKRRKW